ncbi:BMP family protein [Chordicoccus furentiruminis]|jgi:basic membrane protein A|uniref:BMP family protein n=1 Tax=Chordicoccus furentiruminis TaxID=2709410 RepID=UPI0023A841A7|nr:BMP family protein [Chordicoccus furentiruminis]
MKKLIAIGLSAMMTMSMTSVAAMADSSAAEAPDVDLSGKKICLILPGSIDDQGWNATNNAGAEAAEKELGVKIDVVESVPAEEYESTFVEYGEKGYDLIMAAGSQFDEAATTVAPDYPDSLFCVINGQAAESDNQCPVFPKEYEGSYLAGIMAGYATTNGQFATMGGESNEPMVKLLDTYEAMATKIAGDRGISGAKATRSFVNSWTDVSATKDLTSSMIDNGADTVFCYSNEGTSGAIQAAEEKGAKFIGFSSNKNDESDCVYGSVAMDWANVYPTIVKNVISGAWTGETQIGVKEGVFAVDYTDQCSDECKAAVDQAVKDITDGKIDFTQYFGDTVSGAESAAS